jgi:hypothetical protein
MKPHYGLFADVAGKPLCVALLSCRFQRAMRAARKVSRYYGESKCYITLTTGATASEAQPLPQQPRHHIGARAHSVEEAVEQHAANGHVARRPARRLEEKKPRRSHDDYDALADAYQAIRPEMS